MKPFLINYYFSEKLYRLGYITLSFFFFFQLFFTYKREILYIITNQLNYPYFIAYSVADLFFINISLAFFLTIIINLPYIYLQYLLYNKTTYTKTNQKTRFKYFIYLILYYTLLTNTLLFFIIPKIWNWFLIFEIYNTSLLIETTPHIQKYINFLTKTYILFFFSNLLIYFIIGYLPKKPLSKKYITLFYSRIFIYPIVTLIYSIITPPDIITLICLLIPFAFIYEVFLITLLYKTKQNNH